MVSIKISILFAMFQQFTLGLDGFEHIHVHPHQMINLVIIKCKGHNNYTFLVKHTNNSASFQNGIQYIGAIFLFFGLNEIKVCSPLYDNI